MQPIEKYLQYHDGAWYVSESGVQVYGVIALWQQGLSPEEIQISFPALALNQVYGTILYYLEHRDAMDAFFSDQDTLFEHRKAEAEAKDPAFYMEMRDRMATFRSAQGQSSPAPSQ